MSSTAFVILVFAGLFFYQFYSDKNKELKKLKIENFYKETTNFREIHGKDKVSLDFSFYDRAVIPQYVFISYYDGNETSKSLRYIFWHKPTINDLSEKPRGPYIIDSIHNLDYPNITDPDQARERLKNTKLRGQ